jgi:MFS family permease
MNFGGEGDVGRRVGMYLTVVAFGTLLGPPVSGLINKRTEGFRDVGVYAGEHPYFVGGALLMIMMGVVAYRECGDDWMHIDVCL